MSFVNGLLSVVMENITKVLMEKHGKSKLWIQARLGCSDQSVANWLGGKKKPFPAYQKQLERLLKQLEKDLSS